MRKFLLFTLFTLIMGVSVFSQVLEYKVAPSQVGWINMAPNNSWVGNCDDCSWGYGLNSSSNFYFYDMKINNFDINTNGEIGINSSVPSDGATYPGNIIPSCVSSFGAYISYGGNTNGKVPSTIYYKLSGVAPNRIMTFQIPYSTESNLTSYSADIQVSFVESMGWVEINYKNVTGSTEQAMWCGLNYGNCTNGITIDAVNNGLFPTTDTAFLFIPNYTSELKNITANTISSNCNLGSIKPTISLFNLGSSTQTDIPVYYSVNGGAVVSEVVPVTLAQLEKVNYTFNQGVDLSADGIYKFQVGTSLSDFDTTNNLYSYTIINYPTAVVSSANACYGESASIQASGSANYVYQWQNPDYPGFILQESSLPFVTGNIYEPTTYQVKAKSTDFWLVDFQNTDTWVDHGDYGDDRAGVAITQNYFYVVTDDQTLRFNAQLTDNVNNLTELPIRDGLFSDLSTGKLYEPWNIYINEGISDNNNIPYTVNSLIELDENLDYTSNIIMLTDSFVLHDNSSEGGVFAGKGYVCLKNGDGYLYKIQISTGLVDSLGIYADLEGGWYSENWALWGVLEEINGVSTSIIYPYGDNEIRRMDLASRTWSLVGYMPRIDDFHSFTISPWNNRIYYHSETSDEDAGYINATIGLSGDCWTDVVVNVVDPAWAGYGYSANVCNTNNAINLSSYLVGDPDMNGVWTELTSTGAVEDGVLDATLLTPGNYEFKYTVNPTSPCTESSETTVILNVDICASISEDQNNIGSVYPNPSNGMFTIEVPSLCNATITDIAGRVILNEKLANIQNSIDISSYAKGVYTLELRNDKQVVNYKLIVK